MLLPRDRVRVLPRERERWGKMAAHLSYGRVNLNVLREAVRRELREFLDKCAGSKVRDGRWRQRSPAASPAWPVPVPDRLSSRCTRSLGLPRRGTGGTSEAGRGTCPWVLRHAVRSRRGIALVSLLHSKPLWYLSPS